MPVLQLELPDLAATRRLGALLADGLAAGDVVSLTGGLGAGKSELARAIIQAANPHETDIPSPTFTLVQTY
jgi:tRNA A37 threonylcarbamoyladenosine biosynthesis protein TsaE